MRQTERDRESDRERASESDGARARESVGVRDRERESRVKKHSTSESDRERLKGRKRNCIFIRVCLRESYFPTRARFWSVIAKDYLS